jgi:heme-degrading monooxygenase HmoA
MVTIGMNYRVLTGKEAVFESAFESVLEAMTGMQGHESSALYRRIGAGAGAGKPAEYLIVSRWQDEGAFTSFIRSDRFKKVTNWGSEHILAGPPSHTTYRDGSA